MHTPPCIIFFSSLALKALQEANVKVLSEANASVKVLLEANETLNFTLRAPTIKGKTNRMQYYQAARELNSSQAATVQLMITSDHPEIAAQINEEREAPTNVKNEKTACALKKTRQRKKPQDEACVKVLRGGGVLFW